MSEKLKKKRAQLLQNEQAQIVKVCVYAIVLTIDRTIPLSSLGQF